jgi:hypothetical protein
MSEKSMFTLLPDALTSGDGKTLSVCSGDAAQECKPAEADTLLAFIPRRRDIPDFLRVPTPEVSSVIVMDSRVKLNQMLRTLRAGGFAVIADRDGQLVVTEPRFVPEFQRAAE